MRYLVENSRPRQVVTLFGKVLASGVSSSRNKPGQMWLSESQFQSAMVARLVEMKRLRVVRTEGVDPLPVRGITQDLIVMDEVQPLLSGTPIPDVPTAPRLDPTIPMGTDETSVSSEEPTIEEPSPAQEYTAEELESRLLPELRAVCSSLKLDPKGKKADLIERILASQESQ